MRSIRGHKKTRLLIALAAVLVIGAGVYWHSSNAVRKLDKPEYLSFAGGEAFSVPKNYVVDEQAISGVALVYSGSVIGQSVDQIYAANNISLQPITFLKDRKSGTFKNYVNNTFVPDAKKVLSPDVSTQFTKAYGWDVAKITVKKDGQPFRFIYLKNGQHPVSIVSKEETAAFKTVELSVTDVEKTDLKNEAGSLKKTVQNFAQLIKDKNATGLYAQVTSDFKSKNTQADISTLLTAEEVYSQGTITINGGSYNNSQFDAVINFAPLNKDFNPASGVISIQKVGGQWKLKGMQLPNPLANKVSG